jgi:D-arabinose 1-dehydrogenase-like Zn-dependent alcohol dehydrogenase
MKKMRAVQVAKPKGLLEVVERNVPEPTAGTVLIKVEACGICHSDSFTVEGLFPGIQYPRVPGHEVVGTIETVGPGVVDFAPGQRVGVSYNGGFDGTCDACRRGDFFACRTGRVTGLTSDGGYAEYMVARSEAIARIPDNLRAAEIAPLMCAGLTTFNALRNSGARPGDLVAVVGVGGLGHLAVQFGAKMGFRTVAIARGRDKERLAKELGAVHYIDNREQDSATELTKLGGARAILVTAPSAQAMSSAIGGLAVRGKLIAIGVPSEAVPVPIAPLIMKDCSIAGWYSGTSIDVEDTITFSEQAGVRPTNEYFPLERAAEGYARMMSGKARLRAVLTMTQK